MSRSWEEVLDAIEKGTKPEDIEEFTCNKCEEKKNCKYAYDLWNLAGDCLAHK